MTSKDQPRKRFKVSNPPEIKNLQDLIRIGQKRLFYKNIDSIALWNILPYLDQLDALIGMENVKKSIFEQILYFIQGFHKRDINGEYLHCRITGVPGTGKTTVAHIIANIYSQLGILKGKPDGELVKLVHRDDFIAGYVGQTGLKTKKLLTSCLGGVMIYDEGYSMGSNRDDDSFAKEAVDALTSFLSEHKTDFCFIIVGYQEDIEKYFFSMNKGLARRIPWYHKIDEYSDEDMARIALKMINDINWQCEEESFSILTKIFRTHKELFKHQGGDIENFLTKAKIAHANRVFTLPADEKFILMEDDFNKAIKTIQDQQPTDDKGKFLNFYN